MASSTNSSLPDYIHDLYDYIHDRVSPDTSSSDPRMSCGETFIQNIESSSPFSALDDVDKFERPMRSNSSSSFDSDASFSYADSRSVPNLKTPSPFDIDQEILSTIEDYESQLPSYGQEDLQSFLPIPGNADRWSFSPEQVDQFERPMSSNSSSSSVQSSSSSSQIRPHRGETKRGRGRPRIHVPPHKDDPNKRKQREYHQTYWVQRENRVKTEVAQKYENVLKEIFKKVHCQEDRETMKRLLHENDIRL
uniref:Uncharacterized protein n=1 Tax=Acrobeloides nanus TaxID=290746 RepID=A0A914C246_9BILA